MPQKIQPMGLVGSHEAISAPTAGYASDSTPVSTAKPGEYLNPPSSKENSSVMKSSRRARCVLQGSCPQLLDAPLRTTQHPVDDERVGVGCHLRRDPGDQPHQGLGQGLPDPEDPLEARTADLHLLPYPG